MPAPPEFRDAGRAVGIVEVLREGEAENRAQADGHVAVGREIKIDLQHEAHGVEPVKERVRILRRLEVLHELAEHIGDQNLLGKTQHEAPRARRRAGACVRAGAKLRRHVRIADDGPGDELGEHGNIGRQINGILLRRGVAAPDVHDIAQNLEGVEADADGQRDLQRRDGKPRDGPEGIKEEVRVLEIGK